MDDKRWSPGKGSPTDYLIACFADATAAEAVLTSLRAQGFADHDLLALHGREAYEELRRVEEGSPLRRFALMVQDLSVDRDASRVGYLEELQQGHSVIYVYAPDQEREASAYGIVHAAHGYKISHHGSWTSNQLP